MQEERPTKASTSTARLSPAQFAELFVASHARLWVLATALLGDRHEADDLVQEAAMVALKKLDQFVPESNFAAWMAKIVRMHAINWRRKKAGRRTAAADPTDLDQSQSAPDQTTREPQISDAAAGGTRGLEEGFDDELLQNLLLLDEIPRACLLLRVVHGLTYDEIAETLEIPSGTAMSHVHRSKRRLRDEIAKPTTPASTGRERT